MALDNTGRRADTARIVVIGAGNPYRGDDAVGVVFSRRVRDRVPDGVVVVEAAGEPASLSEVWRGAGTVFLVDAVHPREAGDRILRFEAQETPLPVELFRLSTHGLGVAEAIELSRALGELPPRVVVYGVRGERFGHNDELSPEVDKACDEVVRRVTDEISLLAGARGDGGTGRMRIVARGTVQGVGFRPFVYRLASELRLSGRVNNTADGVYIEVEGRPEALEEFLVRIPREKPAVSTIHSLEHTILDPAGYRSFEIVESERAGEEADISTPILPDIAACPACLREMRDPGDRRFRYPFVNCTNCGPRFSIVEGLPYDRNRTTMSKFEMCPECASEYANPADRRFHAQPNACPVCGPQLEWWDSGGRALAGGDAALLAAAAAIRRGEIAAVKGLGGFHLVVDARNEPAVRRLRERKHRDEKPFAVMAPDMRCARSLCEISDIEAHLLESPEAPIVLMRNAGREITSDLVAPGNPYLGVMLPYTPLHHLLLAELGFPVVATSANLAEEPICTDEREALERLGGIADAFLVHDRPIARHVDDSVVRVVGGRALMLRRARGYAPLPLRLRALGSGPAKATMLAVGGHLKNTVAITRGDQMFVSQHIGDMSAKASFDAFRRIVEDFGELYRHEPDCLVCDAHPDYATTRYAAARDDVPVIKVQHHFAHVAACMAENELDGPVLGVSWDGTGYGTDGTVWGGEFLRVEGGRVDRFAHLRTFRLPGGDAAAREPRRSAAGLLYELFGGEWRSRAELLPVRAFENGELGIILEMLRRTINSPVTSSAGRLFDAVASITGLRQKNNFEGQAAMELEFAAARVREDGEYLVDFIRRPGACAILDWKGMICDIIADVENGVATELISVRFHNALAKAIVEVARAAGDERVLLTGGCFQNKYLTEKTAALLETAGFKPYWHQRIPPNDGGIALGQLAAAAMQQTGEQR